jgi:hypothetical protein
MEKKLTKTNGYLEPNMRGTAVKRLQNDLRRLGFEIADKESFFGVDTLASVRSFQREQGLEPADGIVNSQTAARINKILAVREGPLPNVVRGRVVDLSGQGLANQIVRVFSMQLETEKLLGKTATDDQGHYEVRYESTDDFVHVQVRVLPRIGARPVVSSPVILNAEPEEIVNLAVGEEPFRGETQFEQAEAALLSKTERDALPRLKGRAIAMLAQQVGVPEGQAAAVIEAHKLAQATKVDAAVWFALTQEDPTRDRSTLLAEGKTAHRLRLKEAIRNHRIPASLEERVEEAIDNLQDLAVEDMLEGRGSPVTGDVAALLSTTRLSDAQKRRFLRSYIDNEDPLPDFWKRLKTDEAFNQRAVDDLQVTLQLGTLTLNHPPLVRVVKEARRVSDARELAGLDVQDWLELMGPVSPPEAFAGETAKNDYAQLIVSLVTKAYPTARLLTKWAGDPELGSASFRTFMNNNPEFDFRGNTVQKYIREHPDALRGIEEREQFRRNLEGLHRLFSLVPDAEKFTPVRGLWQAGLRSAHAIVGQGRGRFLRRVAEAMDEEQAMGVYARARQKAALSLATLVKYSPAFDGITPHIFGDIKIADPPDEIPNWKNLFGSLDFCECRHCRSMLSPAAYFVDLLQFLERADVGQRTALDALLDLRPDLAHIRLDCANTNTAMPYIDLTNELLENAVVNGLSTLSGAPHLQTTTTTEALRANPEHIHLTAYDDEHLAGATFPWSLPFNLWHEERALYLGHLGIKVWELMDVFHREGEAPEPVDRATAYLGMTRTEREIIVESGSEHGLGTTNAVLEIMRRSQTTLEQLQELLTSRFINSSGQSIDFSESCALEDATLPLSQSARRRLHRFRRLQKITGLSVFELDLILEQLQFTDITGAFVIQLAFVSRLTERIRLAIPELMSWWAPTISTRSGPDGQSLYRSLFLNPAINNPLNPVETFFALDENDTEPELHTVRSLFDAEGNLDGELGPLVVGALNITEVELRLLIEHMLPSPEMNFRTLSHLYRVASFSRALGISIQDYLILVRLIGQPGVTAFDLPTDELVATSPETTWKWIETYERLRGPGFRVAELNYLLLHRFAPSFSLPLTDEQIGIRLIDLQSELRKLRPVEPANAEAPTPQEVEEITTWLGEKLALVAKDGEEALRIVRGVSSLSEGEQGSFIEEHFAVFLDPETLSSLTDKNERLLYVYRQLLVFLSTNVVVQRIAEATGLEVKVARDLLLQHLPPLSPSHEGAIDVFLTGDFISPGTDPMKPQAVPDLYAVMRRLAKVGLILSRLAISSDNLQFLFSRGPTIGWYDLGSIPVEPVKEDAIDIEAWIRFVRAQMLSRQVFSPPFSLATLLQADLERDAFLRMLSEQTGWDLDSLRFLTGPEGYNFAFPDELADERWISRLHNAFGLLSKAGVSGAQIWNWNVPEADVTVARTIKNAAKAKYSIDQWLTVASELSNQLRIRRRDALVEYLIAESPDIDGSDGLYDRLLIDPAVQPCFLTSRIKQAISSVQLFIHRIFLGLVSDARFGPEDADEWSWRKNYRIWEAGRRIFFHTEDFLEPELRKDKSPFFQELEENLLQEEVTAGSVERAYLRYLRSLDEVARLEIAGLYIEEEINVLHIIGRTRGTPPVYYYRRYVDHVYFTPWERIEVNIEGNHILPVVYNRRLWILWLAFTEKSESSGRQDELIRYYHIHVSWTEYRDGKWSSPKKSKSAISTRVLLPNGKDWVQIQFFHGTKGRYYFWAEVERGALNIYPFYHYKTRGGFPYLVLQPSQFFSFRGCSADPVTIRDKDGEEPYGEGIHARRRRPYRVPSGAYWHSMKFSQSKSLVLWSELQVDRAGQLSDYKQELILNNAPEKFLITPPHQYTHFVSQGPFFYEDTRRTFLVVPRDVVRSTDPEGTVMLVKDHSSLDAIRAVRTTHLPSLPQRTPSESVLTLPQGIVSNTEVFTSRFSNLVIDRRETSGASIFVREEDRREEEEEFDIFHGDPFPSAPSVGSDDVEITPPHAVKKYRFLTFYHPYTCKFIEQLNRFGIDGLLNPGPKGPGKDLHRQLAKSSFVFTSYGPQPPVEFPRPTEDIDFLSGGAYSDYNWEIFFHIPMLLANRLSQNQQFEEAQRWFHYIFDPTATDAEGLEEGETQRRFWKIKPFYDISKAVSIQELITLINHGNVGYENQVARWEADPFNPHFIASLREVPYMKMVVMKYLDNLIAWADHLFRRDTIESLNEATQLYILAAKILGRRPVEVPGHEAAPRTFDDLRDHLDVLSNALTTLESEINSFSIKRKLLAQTQPDHGAAGKEVVRIANTLTFSSALIRGAGAAAVFGGAFKSLALNGDTDPDTPHVLYFCVPHTSKLRGYFDTLADRLFKIRNCMNIEGLTRTLALFEPPIDPGLLVKAAAAGLDLNSALDNLNAPLPHYRFTYILQRAIELCNEVKGLGSALLSALEKKDAEALAVLRSNNQVELLKFARTLKQLSVDESKAGVDGLKKTKDVIQQRYDFYSTREFKNASEALQESHLETANLFQLIGQGYDLAANIAHMIPEIKSGFQALATGVTFQFGGNNVGQALQVYSKLYALLSSISSHKATMAGIKAGHERRKEEWDFQATLAQKELAQIDRQIAAAEIRVSIAERDLANHDLQIEQAQEEDTFLKDKFTNHQLYGRLVSQVSTAYFQTYQMAYDLANRAERCFRHELGVENTNFIEFGYWDNLIKGLHAGDRLLKDLRRMEMAYIEQNRREYEVTQHFSLALLNPRALLQLRETGECRFSIPELAFDLIYPGQYCRRIKTVGLTAPCVTGPYTNVNARLTLEDSRVRINGNGQQEYAYLGLEDPNFHHYQVSAQSIATSGGQDDSGLFQLNFQDERYLPFERLGAISTWRLSLPDTFRSFDYKTISDVILHFRYTAREGGDVLRNAVQQHVSQEINRWLDEEVEEGRGLLRLMSLKQEFPHELHHILISREGEPQHTTLPITQRHFPYYLRDRNLTVTQALLFLKPRDGQVVTPRALNMTLEDVQGSPFTADRNFRDLQVSSFELNRAIDRADGNPWELLVTEGVLNREVIDDLYLLLTYTVATS